MADIVKARIKKMVIGKSKYNRTGEYIAMIKPVYFKNGNMKKTDFQIVEILECIKPEYDKFCKLSYWSIDDILND